MTNEQLYLLRAREQFMNPYCRQIRSTFKNRMLGVFSYLGNENNVKK